MCPGQPIYVNSNENDTKLYLNDEYIGTNTTVAFVQNKKSGESYFKGSKYGCNDKSIQVEHNFDWSVFYVLDLRNVARLVTWNVYEVDYEKDRYNVTPICEKR